MDKYMFEEWVSKTVCLVEADEVVQGLLWQRYAQEAVRASMQLPTVSWEQRWGVGMQIGTVDGRPVCVSVVWNVINGQLVGFYSGTSQVVDHEMIETYLKKTFANARRFRGSDFLDVIAYLREFSTPVELEPERVLGREAVENFRQSHYLNTRVLEVSMLAFEKGEEGAREVHEAVTQLNELGGTFRDLVWRTWLKRDFEALPTSGASSTVGGLQMLVFTTAGRILVTLRRAEHEDALAGETSEAARNTGVEVPEIRPDYARMMGQPYISLLGYTGTETGMYVRGCSGDQETLSNLLNEAIENSELFRQNLCSDVEVGIAV